MGPTGRCHRQALNARPAPSVLSGVATTPALALVAALLLSGSAARAEAAAAPTLTVTAVRSGSTVVTLERDSTVRTDAESASGEIAVAGRGRLLGVLLNRLGPGAQPSLLAYRANLCATPGCTPLPDDAVEHVSGSGFSPTPDGTGSTMVLPAGTYAVTAFTDGAPLTAVLSLSGLARSLAVRPTSPAAVRYDTLPTAFVPVDAPAGLAYSAGSTYATRRPSYTAFVRTDETVAAGAAQVDGECYYSDGPPPAGLYVQSCPAVDGSERVGTSAVQTVQDPRPLRLGAYGALGPLPPDTAFSVGQYVYSAVPLRDVFALQVVVELPDGRAAAAGPARPVTPRPATAVEQPPGEALATTGAGAPPTAVLLVGAALGLVVVRRRLAG